MTIPRATATGIELGVSPPKPSGITPRFVSHSNKVTQTDSLWERAVLRRGLHPWQGLHPGRGAGATAMGFAQGPSLNRGQGLAEHVRANQQQLSLVPLTA